MHQAALQIAAHQDSIGDGGCKGDVVTDGVGESVIKCPYPLNVLKYAYDYSFY